MKRPVRGAVIATALFGVACTGELRFGKGGGSAVIADIPTQPAEE